MTKNPSPTYDDIRAELEAAYRMAERAYMGRDARALLALVTADFVQVMPDGQVIPRSEVEPALAAWFATTDAVSRYQVAIQDVVEQDAEAIAIVREDVESLFTDASGARRHRKQDNRSRTLWKKTPAGWRIARVEYLHGSMSVDGVAVP